MKRPSEYIVGFLFTVTSMLFWYGGYAILFLEHAIIKYWPVTAAIGMAYWLGRIT